MEYKLQSLKNHPSTIDIKQCGNNCGLTEHNKSSFQLILNSNKQHLTNYLYFNYFLLITCHVLFSNITAMLQSGGVTSLQVRKSSLREIKRPCRRSLIKESVELEFNPTATHYRLCAFYIPSASLHVKLHFPFSGQFTLFEKTHLPFSI